MSADSSLQPDNEVIQKVKQDGKKMHVIVI